MVVPLDLEMAVQCLIKPTVVSHDLVRLKSASTTEQESRTVMHTEAHGVSVGQSYSQVESVADMVAEGESSAESIASSLAEGSAHSSLSGTADGVSTGTMMLPDGTLFHDPTITGLSMGQ